MRVVQISNFPRRFGPIELLTALVCAVSLADFSYRWSRILGFFWDISVYQRAVSDYSTGVDPYRTDVLFPFVYHPLVLRMLALLGAVVSLKIILPVLTVGAIVWLARELAHPKTLPEGSAQAGATASQVITPTRFLAAVVMAGAFGGVGAAACMSGNLAGLMHFALMAALLRASRTSGSFFRFLPYGLILLAALVKPYFLLYLAVPVMLFERRVLALGCSVAVVALFGAIWFSFQVYWPQEYAQFLANLRWHILGRGDMGYTFFFVFGALTHHKVPMALGLHSLVSVLMIVLVPLLFKQKYGREAPFVPQLLVLYLALTLANPRMKDYDLFPALVGFFAVFWLLSRLAAAIVLAALVLTVVPLLSSLMPEFAQQHPILFDPFGTWQIVGLAFLGVAFLMVMQEPAPGTYAPASRPLSPAPTHDSQGEAPVTLPPPG